MKKGTVYLMLGAMVCWMAACGNGAGSGQTQESGITEESAGAGGQSAAQGTDTQESVPETGGQESAGQQTDGWSEEMTQIRDAVVDELGDRYWPNTPMDASYLASYYGVGAELYDDFMGEMPMISTNVDTLLIIKAKSDKVEEVEKLLLDCYDHQVNDSIQYPMNLEKVQAARVQRIGDYVCYVQLGGPAIDEENMDDRIRLCQEQNDHVIEIISQRLSQE